MYVPRRGMGDISTQQITQIAAVGASSTVAMLAALHVAALGGPVGVAIGALIAVGSLIANMFHGCGETCVVASNDANKIEPVLKQNLDAYLAAPVHYASMQAAALNNFDTVWQVLVQACSNPQLQDAGRRCISDRQAGACQWKASASGWSQQADGTWKYTYAGPAGSGSTCWNWFVGYRDPIANDPTVVPDPPPGAQTGSDILSSIGFDPNQQVLGMKLSTLVVPGALLLAALMLPSD